MELKHLNSIEGSIIGILNQIKDNEDNEMPIERWSDILKPWCIALNGAYSELKSFRPYISDEYKKIKIDLFAEWSRLLSDVQEALSFHGIELTDTEIETAYEEIEDKIDRGLALTNVDCLQILDFSLLILLERIANNDYLEVYNLITIEDAINDYDLKCAAEKVNHKLDLSKVQFPTSVYAWLCFFADELVDSATFEYLQKKYFIPSHTNSEKLKEEYNDVIKMQKELKNKPNLILSGKTRGTLGRNFRVSQYYFENYSSLEERENLLKKVNEMVEKFGDLPLA